MECGIALASLYPEDDIRHPRRSFFPFFFFFFPFLFFTRQTPAAFFSGRLDGVGYESKALSSVAFVSGVLIGGHAFANGNKFAMSCLFDPVTNTTSDVVSVTQ